MPGEISRRYSGPKDGRVPKYMLRGGPGQDYPCDNPHMIECANSHCQAVQRCRLKEYFALDDGDSAAPDCGCVFCDLNLPAHEDAQGFHHVIEGERVECDRIGNQQSKDAST